MGLISLPYLNKIQDSNYWSNVWDSKLLYKKYLYLSLFLNKFLNILFLDYSLNILAKNILAVSIKKGYVFNNIKTKIKNKKYVLGKLWILKYQNWFIVIVNLFNMGLVEEKNKKNKKKIKNWNTNTNLNYLNFMNYKNKF